MKSLRNPGSTLRRQAASQQLPCPFVVPSVAWGVENTWTGTAESGILGHSISLRRSVVGGGVIRDPTSDGSLILSRSTADEASATRRGAVGETSPGAHTDQS
jgi:hypothetical protein